jgi:hypothetical protein
MATDGTRGYTEFEDKMIRKLYPLVGDERLAKHLKRPIGGIYARRLKLKVKTNREERVSKDVVSRVEIMLLDDLSMVYIASVIKDVTEHDVQNIRDKMFARMNKEKQRYIEPVKSFPFVGGKDTHYWKDEQQIMDSFDPQYDPNELTGWEKDQLNNSIKSEYKSQVL